jgi:hypothetical protein
MPCGEQEIIFNFILVRKIHLAHLLVMKVDKEQLKFRKQQII